MQSQELPSRPAWYRVPSKLEWFVIAAVVVGLAVLLFDPKLWASSGKVLVPVRVIVFDATTHKPIQGASVRVVWPRATLQEVAETLGNVLPEDRFSQTTDPVSTAADGSAVFHIVIGSGASWKNRYGIVFTDYNWVMVQASGYGTVLVPLRHEPTPRKWLREQEFLPVYVGVSRTDGQQP
jgi:hypothetical protein